MSGNIKVWSIAFIAVAIVGGGLLLSAGENKKEENVAIRILDSTTPTDADIIKKVTGRDIYEEEGVKLEKITSIQSTGGTVALQALLANNVDTAGSAWTAWINIIASGGKIKALLGTIVSTKNNPGNGGLLVLENSSIRTIKDLEGKKIAVNVLGAESDYVIRQYLKQNGLSIEKVQLVVVPSANQEQVLRSKQVDAAAWTTSGGVDFDKTVETGGVREIPGTRNYDVKGENMLYGIGFREDFIKDHPDTVRRYIRAYDKTRRILVEEYNKNPEHVKKAYADAAEEKGGNPKLGKYYSGLKWSPEYPFISDKDIQWWLDRFVEDGILKPGQLKPTAVYTNEFNPEYKK